MVWLRFGSAAWNRAWVSNDIPWIHVDGTTCPSDRFNVGLVIVKEAADSDNPGDVNWIEASVLYD